MLRFLTVGTALELLMVASLSVAGVSQAATTIGATPTDLVDVIAGQDLWSYSYVVGGNLQQFEGVNLLFGFDAYRDLSVPVEPVDWLVSISAPDPSLLADGVVSLTSLAAGPTTKLGFTVDFIWTGKGIPGAQPFEVFNSDFAVTDTGMTTVAAVPPAGTVDEPAPMSLLLAGLLIGATGIRRTVATRSFPAGAP